CASNARLSCRTGAAAAESADRRSGRETDSILARVTSLPPVMGLGFAAQPLEGALGMAVGVINSTLLMSALGVPPAAASASVHAVETFTTAASGISHTLHRNVDWKLFLRLVIPGVIGGAIGAYLLSNIDAGIARPFVMTYLGG